MLMDDPISALDVHVRREIFSQVIKGVCSNKTRVLVTHAADYLHLCDRIVLMTKGRITAQGTYEELLNNPQLQ
jgi:ABC-type bacteriocin/lantibiotic exporter with double-glycine peptidase domain